jgi:AAA-like domain
MDASQAVQWVQEQLAPKRLNAAQEIVFVGSWLGKRYQQIAADSGYDFDYLKEVGAQLWVLLSQVSSRSVTKKNVRLVLTEIATTGVIASMPIADRVQFPSDAIPLGSPLYIERPPIEMIASQEILQPGGFVRIKAPRQMGKTSLVLRMLEIAQGRDMRSAVIDFQTIESCTLLDLDRFLKWLCANIARQLDLPANLDEYWDPDSGSKMSCHVYFQERLLKSASQPFLLVLDEVNRIFEHPELAQDFLPLLRSWHDEAARNPIWQAFRLVVVHSTEIYVPLQINQSPFNVGLPIELPLFTLAQFQELARRHGLDEVAGMIADRVFGLIQGHPYLIQLLFYHLRQSPEPVEQCLPALLQQAATPTGIYGEHLRRHFMAIVAAPDLQSALMQVLKSDVPVPIDTVLAYQLESMGLIRWVDDSKVRISCKLYQEYFLAYL